MGFMAKRNTDALTKICIILTTIGIIMIISSVLLIIKKNNDNEVIKDKTIIKIWALHGDIGDSLIKVTDNYTKQNPDIVFEISLFKNDVYKSVIREAMITNEAPDIFYAWGDGFLKEFIDLEAVKDINNICIKEDIYSSISRSSLKSFTFDDKVYSIPLFGWRLMLFANEELFINNNIDIPENYEEFIQVIKDFKNLEITPLSVGVKEPWTLSFYYMMLSLNNVGIDGVNEALSDNSKFANEGFFNAAEEFKELCDINAFSEGKLDLESYNSDFYFSEKNAAMLLNGTWVIPQLEKRFKSDNDINKNPIKVIDFSSFVGKREGIGGYVDGFVINNNSDKLDVISDLYIKIVKEVSDEYIRESNGGIPVWNDQNVNQENSPLLYEIINNYDTNRYHGAYDQELPYWLSKIHLESIQLLFNGEITPEEFINRHITSN